MREKLRPIVLLCLFAIWQTQAAFPQSQPGKPEAPGVWSCPGPSTTGARAVSWRRIPPNVLCDQRAIWTSPAHLVQRKNLVPFLAIAGGAAGLILLDHSDAPYFRSTTSWNSFNGALSSTNTALATALVPASLYGLSLIRHDTYGQKSALLAGEAAVDAEIVAFVFKDATRRQRPREIPVNGDFGDTWFEKSGWTGASGFPSGHAIAAFSIATVIARRYARHKWVPYVAYGSAALIGFSRVSTSAHFPADVFVGAALGYGIGRFAVLH